MSKNANRNVIIPGDTKEKQKKKSDREEKIKKENISEGKRKI